MKINAQFDQRVVVHSGAMPWIDSPMAGVTRRPLDRVGGEVARATSIVRYARGSHFSPHVHTGGEEFIVLDGVFQDEHGDFPAGSYIRNPPQSSHTPGSAAGCVIFVKLWQFDPQDQTHVRLNSNFMHAIPHRELDGVSVLPLYHDEYEAVEIQYWKGGANIVVAMDAGAELLVLDGSFSEGGDTLIEHSWLRLPVASVLCATAGPNGAKIWVKRNHLDKVNSQIELVNNATNS